MNKLVKQTSFAYILLMFAVIAISLKHIPKVMAGTQFTEGVHYTVLDREATSEPEVKVFYTPYCRPCGIMHSPVHLMAERANVKYVDVPMKVGKLGREMQESILAARAQNLEAPFTIALLASIHMKIDRSPETREDLAKLLEITGANPDEFRTGSKELTQQAEELDRMASDYNINKTPTIIINGNKEVHLPSLASFDELDQLLNFLF
ncbi:thioredoxin domain-containing protein [Vibrio coralliirubri]|uniref:thioredoxin domain-containing protein n=1 Tax=Vibrio coralliirubri TaxID=1516159 RepID=UPI000A3B5C4E|nr:thioredoxin domain-containing protein [Vibrio coralliirubri]